MKDLRRNLWNADFSHIYIEKRAVNHPNTQKILSHFSKANLIEIDHYKDVFCRRHQSFSLQKKSIKIILAVRNDHFIYEGAKPCEDFGNAHFYYTSSMMNCIYNCEYCYLQGMYPSANIVIFVNIEDTFEAVKKLLKKHPVYLCISYDTDLLAFEGITSFVREWIKFAKNYKDLIIELRTKSANFKAIKDIQPLENIILAWTLSPDEIIRLHEEKTPSLQARLKSIKEAMENGWNVRICFDPLLYTKNWKEQYESCIEQTFEILPHHKIHDVSVGVFRVSKDYLKKMKKERSTSKLLAYPFCFNDGMASYSEKHAKQMINFVYEKVSEYIPKSKIFI
ncbi:radical SAM protein [Crassaminicella thermophila]|uniref:Radical SAM protein n=1 Tax=Crassaminicella thermophila TaxID=2599308 RepID=A0A5C0SDG7_CRATE|nr:radical SAM protein [Crassaminicella thermophila]QEK10969.1 radical SAM protein [Crassaminicella thermophila]